MSKNRTPITDAVQATLSENGTRLSENGKLKLLIELPNRRGRVYQIDVGACKTGDHRTWDIEHRGNGIISSGGWLESTRRDLASALGLLQCALVPEGLPTELERDEVFEKRLCDETFRVGISTQCAWCGNGVELPCVTYSSSVLYYFCSRDHAIKWNDARRRKFPAMQYKNPEEGVRGIC